MLMKSLLPRSRVCLRHPRKCRFRLKSLFLAFLASLWHLAWRDFRVESLDFRVESLDFRVESLDFRVDSLDFLANCRLRCPDFLRFYLRITAGCPV